jgi:putative acetyltransferase
MPRHGARLGYRRCYLETLTGMDAAQKLYEAQGFARIPKALATPATSAAIAFICAN